jgi:UPF0758 protein TTE0897
VQILESSSVHIDFVSMKNWRKTKEGNEMKVVQYKTMIDEDNKNILVKEKSGYYPEVDFDRLDNPTKISYMMKSVFHADNLAEEYVWILALNIKNKLIGVFELSHGTSNSSLIGMREIFVKLCLCGASSFIIVHNHPSGDTEPSEQDVQTTKRINKAGNLMGIPLVDHIIVGTENSYSLRESGVISDEINMPNEIDEE